MVWRATSRFPVVQYTLLYRKVLKNLWTFLERSTNNNLIIRRLEKKHLPTVQADALEWATVLIPGDQDAHEGRASSHLVRT